MPRLEKVAEQYKNDPDVLFISLNVDDNPGLIGPFLKQDKLTFPILPAYDFASDTLKVFSIPQNWVVGPHGVVRLKGIGYDATPKWEEGVKNAIETCKSQAAVSSVQSKLSAPLALSFSAVEPDCLHKKEAE